MSNESVIIDNLIREGCHSIDMQRYKGGWPADQRAPGPTTWSVSGHGYFNNRVSQANHTYFGTGSGPTYADALFDLYRIVRRANKAARVVRSKTS